MSNQPDDAVTSDAVRPIDEEARALAIAAARAAEAHHGTDILVLQVGDVVGIADYFVVVTASNRRLVRALTDEIEAETRAATGRSPLRVEGAREQQWVLLDYGDIFVHVFLSETRDFYEIERLYIDVPKIDWSEGAAEGDT